VSDDPSADQRAKQSADQSAEQSADAPWYAQWRYWTAGAIALVVIWIVEMLRKGGLMWPWPVVPLVIWALVIWALVIRQLTKPTKFDRVT
jgi:hypothetical protein